MGKSICPVQGCDRKVQRREWCNRHYRRLLVHGSTDTPGRPNPDPVWLSSIHVPDGALALPVLISRDKGFTHALVDVDDYPGLASTRWHLSGTGYAMGNREGSRVYLHRYLMGSPVGSEIDHINRTKLDNRRSNLRAVDRSLNSFNQAPSRANTSGHRGVGYFKPAKLWRAYITHQSQPKRIELGYFKSKEEAITARKAAEERYFGECA